MVINASPIFQLNRKIDVYPGQPSTFYVNHLTGIKVNALPPVLHLERMVAVGVHSQIGQRAHDLTICQIHHRWLACSHGQQQGHAQEYRHTHSTQARGFRKGPIQHIAHPAVEIAFVFHHTNQTQTQHGT